MSGAIADLVKHVLPEIGQGASASASAKGGELANTFTSMLGVAGGGGGDKGSGEAAEGGAGGGLSAMLSKATGLSMLSSMLGGGDHKSEGEPQGGGGMKDSSSTVSKLVHTALDVGGMLPGVGTVTEGANAALYMAQGDHAEAALSGMSAIPGAGELGAAAGRVAKDTIGLTKTA